MKGKRPLSNTKRGKFLAAIVGLVGGGPLGLVLAPLVLVVVNKIKKEGNRFLVWSILGIIIAPVLWIPTIIVGIALTDNHLQETNPQLLKEIDEWFFGNPEKDIQVLRDKYFPQGASEDFVQCIYGEKISGGSQDICYQKYWSEHSRQQQ